MPKPVDQMEEFASGFMDALAKIVPAPVRNFNTPLTPSEEKKFAAWKAINAPLDSGVDYDLRGAFKAGIKPDAETGHWPDTFKKPNHPTFSNESQYAVYAPHKAGTWGGPNKDQFIPPPPLDLTTGLPATAPPIGSYVANPYAVTLPPAVSKNFDFGKMGTRNEGVYPVKR